MPNNAASRSLGWIERAIGRSENTTLDAWAAVFGVTGDPNRVRRVSQALAALSGELEAVEKFAEAAGISEDQWRAPVDAAITGLGVGYLGSNWQQNKLAIAAASAPLALRWLARQMPDEGAIETTSDEVRALRADLVALRERIATSDLSVELRRVLYRAIEEMLRAIDEAPISGMRAVRVHSAELFAVLANDAEVIHGEDEKQDVRAFTGLVVRFLTWAPKAERAMAFLNNFLGVLNGGSTLYHAMNPPATVPQLENPAPQGHT